MRIIFIQNLSTRTTKEDIIEWFAQADAKVRDVQLVTGRKTKKSKGFGYVEFYQKESVLKALSLSNTQLQGNTVLIKASEAEKNIEVSDHNGPNRLYVGNLHADITEDMLRNLFGNFGDLDFVTVHNDANSQDKGYAFIQFKRSEHAAKAMYLNGQPLGGKNMRIGFVAASKKDFQNGGSTNKDLNEGDFDDDGYIVNNQKRHELMKKLYSREDSEHHVDKPSRSPSPSVDPSPCILIKNMFDPSAQTNPHFDKELAEEVEEECNSVYGKVSHIYVDKNSLVCLLYSILKVLLTFNEGTCLH